LDKLAHLSHLKTYGPREAVNLMNGGILLSGILKNVKPTMIGLENNPQAKLETIKRFAFILPISRVIHVVQEGDE